MANSGTAKNLQCEPSAPHFRHLCRKAALLFSDGERASTLPSSKWGCTILAVPAHPIRRVVCPWGLAQKSLPTQKRKQAEELLCIVVLGKSLNSAYTIGSAGC